MICKHNGCVWQAGENKSEGQSGIEAENNECLPTLIADLFPHYDRHGQGVVINIRIKVLEYLVLRRARTAPIRPTLPSNSLIETTPRASSGPGGGRETLRDEVNILPLIHPIETASEAVPSEVRTEYRMVGTERDAEADLLGYTCVKMNGSAIRFRRRRINIP